MGFIKLLIAWPLSMAIYYAIVQGWRAAKGEATSDFLKGMVDGFIGLGILLAIPTLLFALVVGWPIMSWLASLRPPWLLPVVAPAVLALLMWVLATLMLTDGWRGAGYALAGYAAVLGLVWACLHLATAPAR